MPLQNHPLTILHAGGGRLPDDNIADIVNKSLQAKVFAKIRDECPDLLLFSLMDVEFASGCKNVSIPPVD